MIPKVIEANYEKEYIIHLCFSDGKEGFIDLSGELYGSIFEPLKDIDVFKSFRIHPDFHTLCWSNGADIAPEFLYKNTKAKCELKKTE